ncbi:hypothetical protein C8R46DRAFT_652676 [Mycena filopes]|nr:hypothetical protein C8R46DRAFT_652676 [Mycena filopes]
MQTPQNADQSFADLDVTYASPVSLQGASEGPLKSTKPPTRIEFPSGSSRAPSGPNPFSVTRMADSIGRGRANQTARTTDSSVDRGRGNQSAQGTTTARYNTRSRVNFTPISASRLNAQISQKAGEDQTARATVTGAHNNDRNNGQPPLKKARHETHALGPREEMPSTSSGNSRQGRQGLGRPDDTDVIIVDYEDIGERVAFGDDPLILFHKDGPLYVRRKLSTPSPCACLRTTRWLLTPDPE